MTLPLNEGELSDRLELLLDDAACRDGISNLANDPFFLAFFLVSVSQGEGLGEAAVALIGQDELAQRIRDLKKQQDEERGHKERSLDIAQALFPEFFEDGLYRYTHALMGQPYYLSVLEANRARLKARDCYSRLNLYLTTTFAYEIMVLLLYHTVADAVKRSSLPAVVRERVGSVLEGILSEEETHVGVVDQHNALLASAREGLSPDASAMLDALGKLELEDYVQPTELAVRQIVAMMQRYADPAQYRADIEAGAVATA